MINNNVKQSIKNKILFRNCKKANKKIEGGRMKKETIIKIVVSIIIFATVILLEVFGLNFLKNIYQKDYHIMK